MIAQTRIPIARTFPPPVFSRRERFAPLNYLFLRARRRPDARARARARARHGFGSGVAWTSVLAAFQRHRCSIGFISSVLVPSSCVTLFGVLHYFVTGRAFAVRSGRGLGTKLGETSGAPARSVENKFLSSAGMPPAFCHRCNNAVINIYAPSKRPSPPPSPRLLAIICSPANRQTNDRRDDNKLFIVARYRSGFRLISARLIEPEARAILVARA